MIRWSVRLLLFGCVFSACAAHLQGGEILDRMRRNRAQYPPRYTRGSMQQYYVYRNRDGEVKVRKTYVGYADHFPPPAYLYYGYPKSGYFTGLSIGGSP